MSAAVIGDIIDALAGVLSCSREVIELAVMTLVAGGHLLQIRSIERVRDIRAACRRVTLAPEMASYIVALSAATRDAQGVRFGVSPRGSLNVAAMTRARALMQGRDFVMADDVRSVVVPVLAHRGCAGIDAGCGSA